MPDITIPFYVDDWEIIREVALLRGVPGDVVDFPIKRWKMYGAEYISWIWGTASIDKLLKDLEEL